MHGSIDGLHPYRVGCQSGWRQLFEDAMARKAEQPKGTREYDWVWRNLTVGVVIASGALLWGYAVYNVVLRTM